MRKSLFMHLSIVHFEGDIDLSAMTSRIEANCKALKITELD
jgi:hypothetical protein